MQQDGLHARHVLDAILVGIFTTEIAQLSDTFPFSTRCDIIHFSNKFLFALAIVCLGFRQVVLVSLVPEIGQFLVKTLLYAEFCESQNCDLFYQILNSLRLTIRRDLFWPHLSIEPWFLPPWRPSPGDVSPDQVSIA